MLDQHVHQHVENSRGQWFALRDPPLSLEHGAIVPTRPDHHGELLQIVADEEFYMWYQTVAGQHFHASLVVERTTGLP